MSAYTTLSNYTTIAVENNAYSSVNKGCPLENQPTSDSVHCSGILVFRVGGIQLCGN